LLGSKPRPKDGLSVGAKIDSPLLPVVFGLATFRRIDPNLAGDVEGTRPHDGELARPHARESLESHHGPDLPRDERSYRIHECIWNRLDGRALAASVRPSLSPETAFNLWWTPAGTSSFSTAHRKARTIYRVRLLTSRRHRSASMIACRAVMSASGPKSRAIVWPYSFRSGRRARRMLTGSVVGSPFLT
jgi:hypothetical protein